MNPGDKDTIASDFHEVETAYRQGAHEEPPELLDRAILNQAKRAIDQPAARPWSFGWIHAAATTALVVLGLTLVIQQRDGMEHIPQSLDQLQPSAPSTLAPASAGAELKDLSQFRENTPGNLFSTDEDRRAAVAKAAAESQAEQLDAGQLSRQIVSELQEADAGLPGPKKIKPVERAPDPDIVVLSRDPDDGAEAYTRYRRDQEQESSMAAEPGLQAGAAAPVDAATANEGRFVGHGDAAQSPAGKVDSDQNDALRQEMNAPVTAARVAAPVATRKARPPLEEANLDRAGRVDETGLETQIAPGAWLEDIRKLRLADPLGQWRAELENFRKIYPDYPIPEDLLENLAEPPEDG